MVKIWSYFYFENCNDEILGLSEVLLVTNMYTTNLEFSWLGLQGLSSDIKLKLQFKF